MVVQSDMPVVSVSMPEAFVERLDEYVAAHGYDSRSEVVRQGTEAVMTSETEERPDCDTVACVVAARLQATGTTQPLTPVRHRYDDLLVTCVHSHPGDSCLELFVAEGEFEEIDRFISELHAADSVANVSHMHLSEPQPLLAGERSR